MTWALDKLFGLVCHQIPGRSPQLLEDIFPLCYRCAGLYGGILCSYLFLWLNGGLRRSFPARKYALLVTIPVVFFLTDAWGNGLAMWNSAGWLRALTGLGAGVVMPILLLPLAGDFAEGHPSLRHPAALIWPVLAGAGFVWLLDRPHGVMVFEGMAMICAAGLAALVLNVAVASRSYFHDLSRAR